MAGEQQVDDANACSDFLSTRNYLRVVPRKRALTIEAAR
jgi:hypothetical protein